MAGANIPYPSFALAVSRSGEAVLAPVIAGATVPSVSAFPAIAVASGVGAAMMSSGKGGGEKRQEDFKDKLKEASNKPKPDKPPYTQAGHALTKHGKGVDTVAAPFPRRRVTRRPSMNKLERWLRILSTIQSP